MDLGQLDEALTGQQVTGTEAVAALVVLVLGTVAAVLVGRAARARFGRPTDQGAQVAKLAARGARWVVQLAAIAWALAILGVGHGWLTLAVALLVVGAALVARPLLESLAAGAVLVARPAFGVGDEVEIDGERGEVVEITGRSTVLRLRDGRRLHLPNREVLAGSVVVYTTERARRSDLDVVVALDSDLDRAERALLEVASGSEAVVEDPPPSVRARELGDGVRLSLRFWHGSRLAEGNHALDQVVRAVPGALAAAGVDLAVPAVALQQPAPPALD